MPAFWLDDFFGPHRYAIVFLDGEVFELDKLDSNYRNQKWVTDKSDTDWKDFPNYNKLRMYDGSKLPLTKKELIKQYPWLKSSR